MRKKIYVILFLLISNSLIVFSQKGNEIGVFAGASYYNGDVNPEKQLLNLVLYSSLIFYHINLKVGLIILLHTLPEE